MGLVFKKEKYLSRVILPKNLKVLTPANASFLRLLGFTVLNNGKYITRHRR